jgi:site-specific recombinase XerD
LSPRAQRHAVTILKNHYTFLVDQCYLIGNPWKGIALPKAADTRINKGRSFTQAQWDFIEQQLNLLPDTSAHLRLRFALQFFYATGLRPSTA